MNQDDLIKIREFQEKPNGSLILISATSGFPALVINQDGILFNEGLVTGLFLAFEDISEFAINQGENQIRFLEVRFPQGDTYQVGCFDSDEVPYHEAMRWIDRANRKCGEKMTCCTRRH